MNMIMNLSLKQNYAVDVLFKIGLLQHWSLIVQRILQLYGLIIIGFNSMYYWELCYMQNYHKIMFLDKIEFWKIRLILLWKVNVKVLFGLLEF